MTIRPFLHLPPPASFSNIPDIAAYIRRMWESLQNTRRGKLECVVEITLTANAASSSLVDQRLSPQSAVFFDPLTATAATAIFGGGMYVTEGNRGNGTWTITHPNTADTDKTFRAAIIG